MGKYMKLKMKELIGLNHYRFAADLTWPKNGFKEAKERLEKFLEAAGDGKTENPHTRVDKETLQGYYLTPIPKFGKAEPTRCVIIGFHEAGHGNSRWGLEEYCSRLIYKSNISGSFYNVTEANDLKQVKAYEPLSK